MSIVERAIKKLQKQAAAAPKPAPQVPAPAAAAAQPAFDETVSLDGYVPTTPSHSIRLDVARLRSARLLAPPDQERELAGQYRHIKRPLIQRGIGRGADRLKDGNALMITSALPAEGKSFTSLNLALSMALEQELRVLLVDADVARPRLSREFGLDNRPGLLEVLEAGTDPDELIVGTDVPTLTLLPSGRPTSNATELLAGPRMEQVVRQLCARDPERMIIFDSSPVLPTTEARALAHSMGQILVVVKAGKTPQQAVQEAIHLLGERSHINMVLTHAAGASAGAYYYASYGYGAYGDPPPGPDAGRSES